MCALRTLERQSRTRQENCQGTAGLGWMMMVGRMTPEAAILKKSPIDSCNGIDLRPVPPPRIDRIASLAMASLPACHAALWHRAPDNSPSTGLTPLSTVSLRRNTARITSSHPLSLYAAYRNPFTVQCSAALRQRVTRCALHVPHLTNCNPEVCARALFLLQRLHCTLHSSKQHAIVLYIPTALSL